MNLSTVETLADLISDLARAGRTMKCKTCEGQGFTAEHDHAFRHGEDGECISCPIQVGCEDCFGTGNLNVYEDIRVQVGLLNKELQ